MGFELAKLFVTIKGDDSQLTGKLASVREQLSGLTSFASKYAVPIGAAAAGITVIGAGLISAASAAGDLAETVSKVETVLGESADSAKAFAQSMHDQFGNSRREMLDAVTTMSILGEKTGKTKGEAEKFGEVMVRLADDLASQDNASFEEAFAAIRSGLAGESEPLKKFIVFMNETAVKAEAVRMGLKGVNGELTEGEKIAARASLMQQQLARVNGDHSKTMGGYNNQLKEFNGRLEELQIQVGSAVVPVFNGLLKAINPIAQGLENIANAANKMMSAFKIPPGSFLDDIMKSGAGSTAGAAAFGPLGSLLSLANAMRGKSAGGTPAPAAGAAGAPAGPASSGNPQLDAARATLAAEREKAAQAKVLEAERNRQQIEEYHAKERAKDMAFGKLFVPGSIIPTTKGDMFNDVYAGINRASEVNAKNNLMDLKSLGSAFLRSQIQGPLGLAGALGAGGQNLLEKLQKNLEKDKFRGSISDSESLSREIQQGVFDAEAKRDEELKKQTGILEKIRDGIDAMKQLRGAVATFGGR